MEVGNAVKDVKGGKIDFKVDKTGIIHAAIGKVSFTPAQICENATALLNEVLKLKPQFMGTYLKSARCLHHYEPGYQDRCQHSQAAALEYDFIMKKEIERSDY